MVVRTYTAMMQGLQAVKIEVEVDSTKGIPGLILVGLPTQAITEAKERITAALHHSRIPIRSRRTVVNLAPADLKKTGSSFDLAITVGILKMYGEVVDHTDDTLFLGELSLDGSLKPIRAALPLALAAQQLGFTQVVLPRANKDEVSLIKGITIFPIAHLQEYLRHARTRYKMTPLPVACGPAPQPKLPWRFSSIQGQALAKKALMVAAAGGHHLFMTGPPGAGKTLLASSLTELLPPPSTAEILDITTLHSLAGLTAGQLITRRPFRSPHHRVSATVLLGGTASLKPGELSLSHHGVLFLDEIAEFPRDVLEALRQPLESRTVTITRAQGKVEYPAECILVAACNPCPCGYFGSTRKCQCLPTQRMKYAQRISGPLLDRFDLWINVPAVKLTELVKPSQQSPAELQNVLKQVRDARHRQAARYQTAQKFLTVQLDKSECDHFIMLHPKAHQFLLRAGQKMELSARSYYKIMKVSQTLADLEQANQVHEEHVAEALQFRTTL